MMLAPSSWPMAAVMALISFRKFSSTEEYKVGLKEVTPYSAKSLDMAKIASVVAYTVSRSIVIS